MGILKRVIVSPAVYSRFLKFLHVDIQSTVLLSPSFYLHCVHCGMSVVLIKNYDDDDDDV